MKQFSLYTQRIIRLLDADSQHKLLTILHRDSIHIDISKKKVKNVNFRLKPHQIKISCPYYADDNKVAVALQERIDWIIIGHQKLLLHKQNTEIQGHSPHQKQSLILWGEEQELLTTEEQRLAIYRKELTRVIPLLSAQWQPIVGKEAHEYRIKKMKTRWGSCNTKAKRVWLSVYLPHYPLACTEYVIVHELCHLHHADHSKKFWNVVAKSMPDYRHWHDMLAGKVEF